MIARLKGRIGAVVLALASAAAVPGVHAAQFDGMVDIGANKLHVVQMGEGPVTVVFEAGFGSDLSVWRKVAPAIAKKAGVLVYSRAGAGQSPSREHGMTLEQSAAEFERMLAAANAKAPFILVGHSYGAFLVRAFAARNPTQVAGLVLVDPADEGLENVLRKIDDARVAQDRRALLLMTPPKFQDELRLVQQITYKGSLPAMPALPDVPAALLTSVRADPSSEFFLETPAAVKVKRERHQAFFSQFSSGAHLVTPHSGHHIQMQEPELVINAVEQVLDAAARNTQRRAQALARQTLMSALEKAAPLLGGDKAPAAEAMVAEALKASQFSEAQINTLGFDVMNKGKQAALAELVLKYNATTFAQSHNAADSYGEVLMALNRPADARRQFERALALGKAGQASARALAGYQGNLDKADKAAR